MSISVVIPTMNEEKTIGDVIKSLQYLNPVEVFVVDTNSTDRTREIAESLGATVVDEPRRGYGRAYKTGIMKCSGDIVVCLDGDGTYPCNVIKPLIEILDANQVDFISCDRMTLRSQNSYTNLHLIGNKILNFSISVLYGYRLFDSQSGMWIFRSEIFKKMSELSDGMSFSQEIKIEALRRGTLIEVPVRYGIRLSKPKLNTWGDGFSNLFGLFIKYVRR